MLGVTDKIFLSAVALCLSPVFVFVAFGLRDIVLVILFYAYALFSLRLVSSDCIVVKSVGYGVTLAPLVFVAEKL